MTSPANFSAFWSACAAHVAPELRHDEASAQARYGRNSTGHQARVLGAIEATSEAQIVAIVKLANEHAIALYPISLGHNWGYGGPTPHLNNCVVLDLHRMNRILRADGELGVVTVEPGVTSGQLYDYLDEHKLNWLVPVVGSGRGTSLIGNALERGFGLVAIADHFQSVMGLRAILPNGTIYDSAGSGGADAETTHLFKWGVGPYLDGIFTQSSFGIVTQMSIALAPRPTSTILFNFGSYDEHPDRVVEFIRTANRTYGHYLSPLSLMNKQRYMLSNPYDNPATMPEWIVLGSIMGDSATVHHTCRKLRALAKDFGFKRRRNATIRFLQQLRKLLVRMPNWMMKIRFLKEMLHATLFTEFLAGKPSDAFLNSVIYDGKGQAPMNPDQDGHGILWYAPLMAQRPADVRRFIEFARPIITRYGFAFSTTFVSFAWRCLDCTLLIHFDANSPEQTKNARACYDELFLEGKKIGLVPYRVGVQGMKHLVDETQPFWQLTSAIKQAIDPKRILSPGRYGG